MNRFSIDNTLEIETIQIVDLETGDPHSDGRFTVVCSKHGTPMGAKARAVIYYCKECDKSICLSIEDELKRIAAEKEKESKK